MTTISHNRRRRRLTRGALALLALLVVLLLSLYIWRAPATSLFWRVLQPLLGSRAALTNTLAQGTAEFRSQRSLWEENQRLKAALASTSIALADRDALAQENTLLKSQFGRDVAHKGLLAGVLLRPPGVPYDTLLIDAGHRHGIVAGDHVYAGGNVLMGYVSEVYETTSRVTLISAPGLSYQAFIHNTLPISLEGQGAGSMRGSVPIGSSVAVGDTISIPGIALKYVGEVSHVEVKEGTTFQTVYMRLPVNIFELKFVDVRAL